MKIFFYGMFMDEQLVASKGARPSESNFGYVEGYELKIGQQATLVEAAGKKTHGVVMTLSPADVTRLYSQGSVAEYVPRPVMVRLQNGDKTHAICFILPQFHAADTPDQEYVQSLFELAKELGMPESYIQQIKTAGN